MNRGVSYQPRDIALLTGLFESRVMSGKHIAALYFDGKQEAAKKRLQKLKADGVIRERPRQTYEPAVYYIARKGFELLRDEGLLESYPRFGWESLRKRAQVSDLTLRHELAVMDVKAALVPAVNALANFQVAEFCTWPLLYQFHARRPATRTMGSRSVLVKPDAHIRIHETEADGGLSEHRFFLEVDRGTETLETLALRAACYVDFYRSGGLAVLHGQPRSAYKEFPFRVLMVLPSEERRDNVARRLREMHPPILTQVWLTTINELVTMPSGYVWMLPESSKQMTQDIQGLTIRKPAHQLMGRLQLLSEIT